MPFAKQTLRLLMTVSSLCAAAGFLCVPTSALADQGNGNVYNWVGNPWYNGWSVGSNWAEDAVPASSENTILNFGTGTYSKNNIYTQTQRKINFTQSLGNTDFTLTGRDLEFTNNPSINVKHSGTATITNDIDLDDDIKITGNKGGTLNLSGAIDGAYHPGGRYWPPPDPGGGIIKSGNSTLILSGYSSNSLDKLVVKSGTVILDKSYGATAVGGNISINGGTLLLARSNQIANNATMSLGGGTFASGGNSDALGSLTLSGSSTIDLSQGGTLNFGDSSDTTWSGTLVIAGWGSQTDTNCDGFSQIYFGTDASSLTADQMKSIVFVDPEGYEKGIYGAKLLDNGQLVPYATFSVIPEPSTVLGGILITFGAGWTLWSRRRKAGSDDAPSGPDSSGSVS